jgi:hypothetical protein
MCNSDKEGPMPIQIAPLVGAGLGALQQSKIQKAEEGTKTFTKPKTIFGKLIGGVSGRTAAAEVSDMYKQEAVSAKVMNALQSTPPAGAPRPATPVTGGISFGTQAARMGYLPLAIIAGVVAIFYFMRRGGRRRR